jgi:hypothetical protein
VQEQRHVATVIDDQLRALAARERNRLVGAPPVLLKRFTLPCKTGTPASAMAAAA